MQIYANLAFVHKMRRISYQSQDLNHCIACVVLIRHIFILNVDANLNGKLYFDYSGCYIQGDVQNHEHPRWKMNNEYII